MAGFADAMIDCKACKTRTRADHLIEQYFESKNQTMKVEGKSLAEFEESIQKENSLSNVQEI